MIFAKEHLEEKRLYKFRFIQKDSTDPTIPDPNKLHYIERIFSHNELYFPSPIDLNDPLECRPKFTVGDLSDQEYKDKYVAHTRRIMIEGGETSPPDKITAWLNNLNQKEAEEFAKEQTNDFRLWLIKYRICSICSFCAKPDNPIVWSHYADSHHGFCLIFDVDNDLFGGAIKVEYQTEYPTLDVTEEDDYEILKCSALVKFSDWKYEEEFRLVSAEPNFPHALPVRNNKLTFPPEMLLGVIFGYKISNLDRQLIENMCKDRPGDFYYKKAILNDDKFVLKIINA